MNLSDLIPFDDLLEWIFGSGGPTRGRRLHRKGKVPDVRRQDLDDARHVLASQGFRTEVEQLEEDPAPVMGVVVEQSPPPGTRWSRARPVTLAVLHPPREPG